jgi:hypothetical protein
VARNSRGIALFVVALASAWPFPAFPAPLDAGNFQPFVDANRLDIEIAHVLNILDHYPEGSWARQTASFAHHELLVGNLLAMVKASNFAKVTPSIPVAALPTELPRLALNAGLRGQVLDAVTVSDVGSPNVLLGYVLLKDSVVTLGTPPGKPRKRLAGIIAHELTHFRNRVFFKTTLPGMTRDHGTYVDPGDPEALGNAEEFMQELLTSHVEWRVLKDIEHKWEGAPVPERPRALGLYSFGLALGTHLVPERNGYLARLATRDPAAYNRQVGLWLQAAGRNGLFHDDPAVTDAVRRQFQDEFDAVQPAFATPVEAPDGGDTDWDL